MAGSTALSITVLVILIISAVISIISIAVPQWMEYYARDRMRHNRGLFKDCNPAHGCNKLRRREGWETATAAMMVIALLAVVVAAIICALFNTMQKMRRKLIALIVAIMAFVALFASLIAVAIYAAKNKDRSYTKFKYAFYLACVHVILNLIAAILGLLVVNKAPSSA